MNFTEKDITGAVARRLRTAMKLSQSAFWNPLGVKQSVASKYESDIPIPQAIRILIVVNYVSGLRIDAVTTEGVAELAKLGSIQSAFHEATSAAAAARGKIEEASHSLQQAHSSLAGL